jgi:hypothetical protein
VLAPTIHERLSLGYCPHPTLTTLFALQLFGYFLLHAVYEAALWVSKTSEHCERSEDNGLASNPSTVEHPLLDIQSRRCVLAKECCLVNIPRTGS